MASHVSFTCMIVKKQKRVIITILDHIKDSINTHAANIHGKVKNKKL